MVRDDDGKNLGIVTTLKDISKETDVENLKMEFLSTVSHELRTPLASVQNVIEIILDKEAGEMTNPQTHLLELASVNVERLSSMIENLLDISKIEDGELKLEMVPVRD